MKINLNRVILYYLYGILLIPIVLRIIFGNLSYVPIHPGLLIHTGILTLLVTYTFKKRIRKNKISYIILGFSIVYFLNLLIVEFMQFSNISIFSSISYTLKIYLLLFLSYYIYVNAEFYNKYINKILLINSIVLVVNVIVSNYFQIGWQSYTSVDLADSYRGFMAGNDTSIFTFISFGYALFSLGNTETQRHKVFYIILLCLSIFSIYIIATKAIFLAAIILFLYSVKNGIKLKTFILILVVALFGVVVLSDASIQQRLFSNYISQMGQNDKMIESIHSLPDSMSWLALIAPGRIVMGFSLMFQIIQDSKINLFFGYGVAGIYEAFGRPPMMHFFSPLGHYGVLGWLTFYLPQLLLAIKIIKKKRITMLTTLYISVFLYGSLGGFIYGNTETSVMYALLFALSLYQMKFKKRVVN